MGGARARLHGGLRPGAALFIALQCLILLAAWRLMGPQQTSGSGGAADASQAAPRRAGGGGGGDKKAAASGGRWPVTSDLQEWAAAPEELSFRPPKSQCILHPDGTSRAWHAGRCCAAMHARPTCRQLLSAPLPA